MQPIFGTFTQDLFMIDLIMEYPYEFLALLGIWAFGLIVVAHGFSKKHIP